jgi:tetratricopeptide (TPR) repeat protein
MAERFLYLPSLGLIIALSYAFLKYFDLLKKRPVKSFTDYFKTKPVFTAILAVVVLLYSFKTIDRNSEWKNNLTLLAQDVKTSPGSARIRYAYGSALLIEKALKENNPEAKNAFLDKSIEQLEKGVSILPNYAEAWNHLGIAYKEKENYPAAINAFEKARSYKEFKEADFYISSGLAYGKANKYDLALADFTKAITIDPVNAEAYNNKGLYLFENGDSDSSIIYFDKAISIKNDFYQAYYNKGNTVAKSGRYNEAITLYEESLKHKSDYVDAWLNMGNSYAALNDYTQALKYFKLVETSEPLNRKVLINIGITYRILGDETTANNYFDKANKLSPTR